MNIATAREIEQHRYIHLYRTSAYGMTRDRLDAIIPGIIKLHRDYDLETALDVGAGRGEVVHFINKFICEGHGSEVVPALLSDNIKFSYIHDLKFTDNKFDLVTCFDVLEHILPEDTEQAISELVRVCKQILFISVNNQPSKWHGPDLHINKRPYSDWRDLFAVHGGVADYSHHTISKYYFVRINKDL